MTKCAHSPCQYQQIKSTCWNFKFIMIAIRRLINTLPVDQLSSKWGALVDHYYKFNDRKMFAVGGKGFQPNIYVYSYPEQQVWKLVGLRKTTPTENRTSILWQPHSQHYVSNVNYWHYGTCIYKPYELHPFLYYCLLKSAFWHAFN